MSASVALCLCIGIYAAIAMHACYEYSVICKAHKDWCHRCMSGNAPSVAPENPSILFWNERMFRHAPYCEVWPKRWCRVFAPWWKPERKDGNGVG